MFKFKILILIILLISCNLFATKYAGEIFRMGAGVRNFALGGCGISDFESFSLAYWNSAFLHKVTEDKFELMHAEEYMGLLTYDMISAIWGKNNKMSIVITRIGIDNIPLTKLENPDEPVSFQNRPYKYKSVNNSDFVIYFGISRKLGNYYLGFTPKFAYRNLAEENGFGFGADISSYYEFSDKWLIAAKIRDFFTTQILWGNGTHEIVNPGFDLESNYRFMMPIFNRNSKIFLGTEMYTEGRDIAATTSLGFLSIDYHVGLELNIHSNVDLYFGYNINNLTSGLSINIKNWKINYSFEQNSELENSHRISIGLVL